MRGLLLKDIYGIMITQKTYAIFFLFLCVFGYVMKSPGYVGTMCVVLFASIVLNLFNGDQYSHWDTYAAALPLGKKMIVRARYLLILVITLALTLFTALITGILAALLGMPVAEQISGAVSMCMIIPIYSGVVIPVIYKLGVEKGRVVFIMLFLIPFIALMLFKDLLEGTAAVYEVMELLVSPNGQWIVFGGLFAVSILVLAISYPISVKIYGNKDF